MNDKVKAKIEAMAYEYFIDCGGDSPNIDTACAAQNLSDGFVKGATPWAKWCERFEQAVESYLKDGDTQLLIGTTLRDYRTWLEGGGE